MPPSTQATIEAKQVILKMDIEGYECKALPEEVIMGSSGKWIPFIFLEWGKLVSCQNKHYVKLILLSYKHCKGAPAG